MSINVFVSGYRGNQWMQKPLFAETPQGRPFAKTARKTDKRSGKQRGSASLVQIQKLAHLPVKTRIGEGIRRQLIAKEIFDNIFGERDRIQRLRWIHDLPAGRLSSG